MTTVLEAFANKRAPNETGTASIYGSVNSNPSLYIVAESGDVEAIKVQLQTIDNDIKAVNDQYDTVKGLVETNTGQISALGKEVDSNTSLINSTISDVEDLGTRVNANATAIASLQDQSSQWGWFEPLVINETFTITQSGIQYQTYRLTQAVSPGINLNFFVYDLLLKVSSGYITVGVWYGLSSSSTFSSGTPRIYLTSPAGQEVTTTQSRIAGIVPLNMFQSLSGSYLVIGIELLNYTSATTMSVVSNGTTTSTPTTSTTSCGIIRLVKYT